MSKRPGDPGYAAGWCIHYRSAGHHDSCEKGVPYSTFRSEGFAKGFQTQPCFLTESGQSKPGALPCEHIRRPTQEEVALHEKWLKARMERMMTVHLAITPWREKHKGKSFAEVIECPVCKGRLHLSIAAYNGHVHGRCDTPGCVSWME